MVDFCRQVTLGVLLFVWKPSATVACNKLRLTSIFIFGCRLLQPLRSELVLAYSKAPRRRQSILQGKNPGKQGPKFDSFTSTSDNCP